MPRRIWPLFVVATLLALIAQPETGRGRSTRPTELSPEELRQLPVADDGRRLLLGATHLSREIISPRPCFDTGCTGDGINDDTDITYEVIANDTIRVWVYLESPENVYCCDIQGITRRPPRQVYTIQKFDGVVTGSGGSALVPDGRWNVIIRAYDDTNRTEIDTLSLTIDRVRPVISTVATQSGTTTYRNGETIVIQAQADGPGYTVTPNFDSIDSNPDFGTDVFDLGGGRYEIRHTLSDANTKTDASGLLIPIRFTDLAGNFTNYNALRLCLSNGPPRLLSAHTINAPDGAYKNAALIQIETTWQSSDTLLSVVADFRGLDSAYDTSMYVTSRLSGNRYHSTYRLSDANQKPDGSYLVPIVAKDRGCGMSEIVTVTIALDTESGTQPVLDAPPSGIRTSAYTVRGTAVGSNRVLVIQNDALVDTFLTDAAGRFEAPVTLRPGTNRFTAEGLDPAGNKTVRSASISVIYVTESFVTIPVPFRPGNSFQIGAPLPSRGVRIELWTLAGDLARVLTDESAQDVYTVPWDGRDEAGARLNSGPLIAVIRTDFTDGSSASERRALVLTAGTGAP